MRLQLGCILVGEDLLDHSVWPAEVKYPITLSLGISKHGTQQTEVFADRRVGGITYVDLDLDGNVEDHPRDRHSTTLWLSAYREAFFGTLLFAIVAIGVVAADYLWRRARDARVE